MSPNSRVVGVGRKTKWYGEFVVYLFSGQSFSVERKQAAPCLLGLGLVVDLRIRRAPAMCGTRIHFDFRGQIRFGERLFQNVLVVGRPHIVVCRNRNEELRLAFRGLRCGLFGLSVTSPPPWNEATAPTRSGTAAAVRNAMGPPMQ